jgi:hypothetical protein
MQNSPMKILLSFITMVTLSPTVATATLVCWDPDRWGGSVNPLAILTMALFGLITVPLWPTYIPAVVATPFMMSRIVRSRHFRDAPLLAILGLSLVSGAIAGIGVISIIVPWQESLDLVLNWVAAGAVSGGVTLPVIALIFRHQPRAN